MHMNCRKHTWTPKDTPHNPCQLVDVLVGKTFYYPAHVRDYQLSWPMSFQKTKQKPFWVCWFTMHMTNCQVFHIRSQVQPPINRPPLHNLRRSLGVLSRITGCKTTYLYWYTDSLTSLSFSRNFTFTWSGPHVCFTTSKLLQPLRMFFFESIYS